MPTRNNLRFLDAPGDVAALMRNHDWSTSPLGPLQDWPQSLRSVVSLLLRSKFPMFVAWGPSLGFLYNDSYAEILGAKHPAAIGCRFETSVRDLGRRGPARAACVGREAIYLENLPLRAANGYLSAPGSLLVSPVVAEPGDVSACTALAQPPRASPIGGGEPGASMHGCSLCEQGPRCLQQRGASAVFESPIRFPLLTARASRHVVRTRCRACQKFIASSPMFRRACRLAGVACR